MSKLIIENRTDIPDIEILQMVSEVIKLGRISTDKKQYCYLSLFKHSTGRVQIATDLNKHSDRFIALYDHNPRIK